MNNKLISMVFGVMFTTIAFAQSDCERSFEGLGIRKGKKTEKMLTGIRNTQLEENQHIVNNETYDDEKASFPRYSHFSINTGLGKTFGKNDFTTFKSPIMIFWENGGNLGKLTDFIDIPNWIYTGAYFRYSKQEVNYYNYYSYNAVTIGVGIRGSVSVFPMIASISGKEMKKTGPFDVYGGLQLGYDYVLYDGYLSYYGYYGTQRGLRVSPFAGARLNLLKWFGVHAELGSTSGRWCTLGVNFRKKH